MSILTALAAPGSAVAVTTILGWVAHRLGTLKIGSTTLAADVAKDWPAVVAIASKIPAIEAELAGTTATAEAANLASGALPEAVSAAVQAEFARLFPQLMTATPVVAPPAAS